MPGQPWSCPEHFPLFRKLNCRKSKENGEERKLPGMAISGQEQSRLAGKALGSSVGSTP
jgi:hypothetical protein